MIKKQRFWVMVCVAVALATVWKAIFLAFEAFPFNSDEAIVALMARHILQGARPVFFYGQAYMGSLDAYLAAAGFVLLGEQVMVIRLVQMLLYAGFLVSISAAVRVAFESDEAGIWTAFLLAIPTVNMTLYTTVSMGGYGEALLIGGLQTWLAVITVKRLELDESKSGYLWLAGLGLGFLTGLGVWANALSLVFTAPAALIVLFKAARATRERRGDFLWIFAFTFVAGGLVGALPWWGFAVEHGFDHLLGELTGSAVAVEPGSYLSRLGRHTVNFLLLGLPVLLGVRPPWEIRWLALPLAPLALVFAGLSAAYFAKKTWQERGFYLLFALSALALIAGFLLTSFGVDPSGRYFLPLGAFLAVCGGVFLAAKAPNRRLAWAAVGAVMAFHGVGTVQSALRNPPGLTTQFYAPAQVDHRYAPELIDFLKANQLTRGYTNYWVAYPLAFLSQEELIYIPALPYHPDLRYTARDNRYAPYNDIVAQAEQIAYITTHNEPLNQQLRGEFKRLGAAWEEKTIGDYVVFYHLNPMLRVDDLNLDLIEAK
ncbi:hypothetical protein ADN00_13675 [Ornatilinea apprima]|uniref:Glycosyltransferase RgtA/B/C/D-like domain-containing protein n=1 Tax=Ornatilinea apprima TaxID=1134406 RepID=A0A0N8GM54_9CHLR|nr:hypothetical protein [Ornatilinea apprima]KPL74346.1 hypothetical protein ADN00_13675 [Ornatilinea apprima]